MTENQAIKILEEEKSWESDDRKIDAFIMAIEALEEIQQYRKIGTVEEFKALKEKNKEQKACCGTCIWYNGELGDGIQFCDDKEVHVSEHSWCARYRRREECID